MNTPHVIMISGKIRSGKDSIAKFVTNFLEEKGKKVVNLKFAAGIKRAVAAMYEIHAEMLESRDFKNSRVPFLDKTFRELYIDTGQALRANVAKDFWARVLLTDIQKNSDADVVVISDWRFKNEAETVVAEFCNKEGVTSELANILCHFFRIEQGPLRENMVRHELILGNFKQHCKEIGFDYKLDNINRPTTLKGEKIWMEMIFKVNKIQSDISETDLDNVEEGYFDLVIQNEQYAFEDTKSTVITYLNNIQW